MIHDDYPYVVEFRKKEFTLDDLEDIPFWVSYCLYSHFVLKIGFHTTFEYRSDLAKILNQSSVKVARRVQKNFLKFLYFVGYRYDADARYWTHPRYPPVDRDAIHINDNTFPSHIILALHCYFVVPIHRGRQTRMLVINNRKKQKAYIRKMTEYTNQLIEKYAQNKSEEEEKRRVEKERMDKLEKEYQQMKDAGWIESDDDDD